MTVKKVTQKDRYGNSTTVEYESPEKPFDYNKMFESIINSEGQLFGWDGTVDMSSIIPPVGGEQFNQGNPVTHPGGPKGEDTVPAWLTPGEFVVNKEAMSIPGNAEMVEQINNQGRMMQQGGMVPNGGMTTHLEMAQYREDGGWMQGIQDLWGSIVGGAPEITGPAHWTEDANLLDGLAEVESGGRNDAVSPAGAVGMYQWLPSSAAQPGYGVQPFDPRDPEAARAATSQYLKGMQDHHGFTEEEALLAYNWGPGNVLKFRSGERKDIPDEARAYASKVRDARARRQSPDMAMPIQRPVYRQDGGFAYQEKPWWMPSTETIGKGVDMWNAGKDAFGDVSETIVGSTIEGTKALGQKAGDAASWAKNNPDAAQKAVLDHPVTQIGGAFVPGVGEALDAREIVEGGREVAEDPTDWGGYGRMALGAGALLIPFVSAGAIKAMGKTGVEATEAAIKAGKSADEVAAVAAKYSDEAADAIRSAGRGGKGLIGDATKRATDWVKDPRTYVGEGAYKGWRSAKEAVTNPVGWTKSKLWDAPVAGRIAHGKVDPSTLKGIAKDAHQAYPWMHPEEALKLFRSEIAEGKALSALHKRHMYAGGMVPQYRFDGGYLLDQLAADPTTNQQVQDHMAGLVDMPYGWNVAESRPYTMEEGIAAGTYAGDVPAPAEIPAPDLSMPDESVNPAPVNTDDEGWLEWAFPKWGEQDRQYQMMPGGAGAFGIQNEMAGAENPVFMEQNRKSIVSGGGPLDYDEWLEANTVTEGTETTPNERNYIVPGSSDHQTAELAAQEKMVEAINEGKSMDEAVNEYKKHQPVKKATEEEKVITLDEYFTEPETEEDAAIESDPKTDEDAAAQTVTNAGAAGKQEESKAKSMLKGIFGDLFDDQELKRMAIMYAGSRLLGYSHAGSLRWSAKNYVNRVDAKQGQYQELLKSGKYTPQSIAQYKKTGDISELRTPGPAYTPTGNAQVKMVGGKKLALQEVKGPNGGIYYQGPKGQLLTAAQIATAKDYEPSFDKGTEEYRARRSRARGETVARFEEVFKAEDRFQVGEGQWDTTTKIKPYQAADEFWDFAETMGLDPESDEARQIMTNAYHQAIADGKTGDVKPTSLKPYLEQQYIRETSGAPELFMTNEPKPGERPKYVRADKMAQLDRNVEFIATQLPAMKGLSAKDAKDRFYQIAVKEWNGLGADKQKMYNNSAGKGESGFFFYTNKRAAQLLNKLEG